jgi:GGDEF domain-containing protein
MISIRKAITDLDRYRRQRELAFEYYVSAIRNAAHYAIELDPALSDPHRKYLAALADEVAQGSPEALDESRATFRGLLRDYRDKASHYLAELREQISASAKALQQIVESLAQSDGDHESRLRAALDGLRTAARSPAGEPLRALVDDAVDTIQQSLELAHREHQFTISQFKTEIRMLHKRIDMLEAAASLDAVTRLFTRREMEDRIRKLSGGYCLLLIKVNGVRVAELNFSRDVAAQLVSAFNRRLRNSLPQDAALGRWSEEEFLAIITLPCQDAVNLATHLAAQLCGSYVCLQSGHSVHPSLQLRVGVVDAAEETADRILQKITAILTGQTAF